MTDRELKKFAIVGMLIQIEKLQQQIKNTTDTKRKKDITDNLNKLTKDYEILLAELRKPF